MHYINARARGYFVHNPDFKGKPLPLDRAHYKVLHDLAQTLALITLEAEHGSAYKDAAKIRKNWDGLKSLVEGYVVACESLRTATTQTVAGAQMNSAPPQPPRAS